MIVALIILACLVALVAIDSAEPPESSVVEIRD